MTADSAADASITQARGFMQGLKRIAIYSQMTVQRYLGSKRTSMVVQEVSVAFVP